MTTAGASLRLSATLAVFLAFGSAPANATTLRLCNGTKDAVEFAIGFRDKGAIFETRGWWPAQPGMCSEPIPRGKTGIYFLHIKKSGGGSIPLIAGNKTVTVCASMTRFTDRPREHRKDGKLNCTAAGLVALKFVRFEMSRADLQDILTLEASGQIAVSNGGAEHPKAVERGAPPPSVPQKKSKPPDQRPASPSVAVPLPSSQTPEACKRFPNLC